MGFSLRLDGAIQISCGSFVSMMQAAERRKCDHPIRTRQSSSAMRGLLAEPEIRAVFVEIVNILGEQAFQVGFV